MAWRGVWQLQKLIVTFCDWGGSSRGIRAFMESHLPAFREKNPQLELVTKLNRGYHPLLKGIYGIKIKQAASSSGFLFYKSLRKIQDYYAGNKNERVGCVKNMTPEDIHQCATRLRNAQGRKVVKLKTRHVTKNPTVQGTWTTDLKM